LVKAQLSLLVTQFPLDLPQNATNFAGTFGVKEKAVYSGWSMTYLYKQR